MSTRRNNKTKKVNNRFRPPETNVVSGRVGRAQQKLNVGQKSAPTQRIFDLTDGKCAERHAGHDPGAAQYTTMCFYVGAFFHPTILIYFSKNKKTR